MPTLITCLSTGKGTWTEVIKLIQVQPWTKVYLITNQFGIDNFSLRSENIKFVVLDSQLELKEMVKQLKKQLQINDFEIALNLISGSGQEHMAVLETILELGLNFRLVTVKNNQLEILGIETGF